MGPALILLVGLLAAALASPQQRYAAPVYPLLAKPFHGELPVSGLFDHQPSNARVEHRQLTVWGSLTWGKAGHAGYDWPMPVGTPILAAADGVVLDAGVVKEARCNGKRPDQALVWARVAHEAPNGARLVTSYLHLSKVTVAAGDRVRLGQQLGLSGNTGCSSGPHLHFGVVLTPAGRSRGYAVDPYGWDAPVPDPRVTEGKPSYWLWLPDQAPRLYRLHRGTKATTYSEPVLLTYFVGVAWNDDRHPNSESISLQVGGQSTRQRVDLTGWVLRNNQGDAYRFPPGTVISPAEPLRLFSGEGADQPGARFWGRTAQAWADEGDCARLLDPAGRQVTSLALGRALDDNCRAR